MCMVRTSECLVAEENIVCYKLCTKDIFSYLSWFQQYPYFLGKILYSEEFKTLYTRKTLYRGGFHSYVNLHRLLEEIESCHTLPCPAYVLKCIIPKGTLYYTGFMEDGMSANYFSQYILPIEEIYCKEKI